MLFEIVFQCKRTLVECPTSCDLMLFEIVFQFRAKCRHRALCCDLMLFEIVFQSKDEQTVLEAVVI